MTTRQLGLAAVITAALVTLLTSMAWAFSGPHDRDGWMFDGRDSRYGGGMYDGGYGGMSGPGMMPGAGMMSGPGMMDGVHGLAGTGPVTTFDDARSAAQRYADRLDLRVGEVMEFDNGFYAELVTTRGSGATEVLVDVRDGDVRIEYGPAMMWNTEYGMHAAVPSLSAQVSGEQAGQLADDWLADRSGDLTAGEVEEFPGYYTVHTESDGAVTGMLSVNAYSGAIWFHSWHGDFVDMGEG